MTNPVALSLREPLDLDDAREAAKVLARQRRAAEAQLETVTEKAADKERTYRKAFATQFVQATGTAAEREAKARSEASQEAYERDLAAGMVKVTVERLRGLEGERSMLKSLTEWSARMSERPAPDGPMFAGLRGQA